MRRTKLAIKFTNINFDTNINPTNRNPSQLKLLKQYHQQQLFYRNIKSKGNSSRTP
mgnify:CR=1 FL=1